MLMGMFYANPWHKTYLERWTNVMRIGINIPNELHRRLEPLKQYINISQICRDAIEDRIKCYEKGFGRP